MSSRPTATQPIPEPKGLPYLGHIAEFRSENSLEDLDRLHDTYGEIFRLRFPGIGSCVFVGTNKLVNEICNEDRFKKSIQAEIAEIRRAVGDGLFTAENEEENWGLAHRILMPAFGPMSIQGMFDEMYDVATQMALKWARHGSSAPIPASEDFTRLALDTLALCSMGYRFNSFYKAELHPFVQSMADSLVEFGNRSQRPKWANFLYRSSGRKLDKDIDFMRQTSREVLQSRKADPNGSERKDLLTAMTEGVDPRTGGKLGDESIINNLVTFLIAGHETTSGTLSFAFYSLLKNPHAYQKAQQEVDAIMGRDRITADKLFKLKYIPAVLRETLRQCSPIPGITLEAFEDTLLDGKYPVKKGEPIAAIFSRAHLDPAVYGEDANDFKPERMLDDNFNRLQNKFPNCWRPFGNGIRTCIGRPFAWQEMLLATALLLQNFDFFQQDPSYNLKIAETLTIKPKDFFMRASLRHGMDPIGLECHLRGGTNTSAVAATQRDILATMSKDSPSLKPISIYYGSNSGTCQVLARRLASSASVHGFRASVVDSVDAAKDRLPQDHPVVIFISSYEGQPPDNARLFVAWLESLESKGVANVPFAVFGAGNSEWRQTFHRIPRLIDERLEKHGAERLVPLGLTNVAKQDPFLDFESWEDSTLWPALEDKYGVTKLNRAEDLLGLTVEVSTPRACTLQQDVKEAIVTAARDLTAPNEPRKRHIEVKLPEGMSYEVGDYLAVLPMNPLETINRVFRRLRLPRDAILNIKGTNATALPMGNPASAFDVLSSYVELSLPATRKDLLQIGAHAPNEQMRNEIEALADDRTFQAQIKIHRLSVLDILEKYPLIELPIAVFLGMLPSMCTRQYSISSSPLHNPRHATLTYSVLEDASHDHQSKRIGVATSYLAKLRPDDRLHVSVRPSRPAFHLPNTPETTPIVCIAAGSGLAPFRGFIQQRAAQTRAQRIIAPALLIFGCRDRSDDLYRDEFDAWESEGVVIVKRAYSRQPQETDGCKYVQHRLLEQKRTLQDLWNRGAKLFVCGSRDVGNVVEATCVDLLSEFRQVDKESAKTFLEGIRNERYTTDVFN